MVDRTALVRAAVAGQLSRYSPTTYQPELAEQTETRLALVRALGEVRALEALGIDCATLEAQAAELRCKP